MVKLIADEQEVQHRLRVALRNAMPDAVSESRQPTVAEVTKTNIPYLDAVIEESLRVRSPLPLIVREALVNTTVLGRNIPKGTQILFPSVGPGFTSPGFKIDESVRSSTWQAKHWGEDWSSHDMDKFNPDRWLKEDKDGQVYDSQAGPFLAFSLGPRGCFGRRLAYLELRMVLVLLVWNFQFKKLEGELARYDAVDAITTTPKFCYVQLEKI
jgi:cytochrome P450